MKIFYTFLVITGILIVANSIALFLSKKDKHRIMTFFRIYKKVSSKNTDDSKVNTIEESLKIYNSKLFEIYHNQNTEETLYENLKKGGIKNLISFILMQEDVILLNKNEDEIQKNKDNRDKLISEIYEKWSMKKYE